MRAWLYRWITYLLDPDEARLQKELGEKLITIEFRMMGSRLVSKYGKEDVVNTIGFDVLMAAMLAQEHFRTCYDHIHTSGITSADSGIWLSECIPRCAHSQDAKISKYPSHAAYSLLLEAKYGKPEAYDIGKEFG